MLLSLPARPARCGTCHQESAAPGRRRLHLCVEKLSSSALQQRHVIRGPVGMEDLLTQQRPHCRRPQAAELTLKGPSELQPLAGWDAAAAAACACAACRLHLDGCGCCCCCSLQGETGLHAELVCQCCQCVLQCCAVALLVMPVLGLPADYMIEQPPCRQAMTPAQGRDKPPPSTKR